MIIIKKLYILIATLILLVGCSGNVEPEDASVNEGSNNTENVTNDAEAEAEAEEIEVVVEEEVIEPTPQDKMFAQLLDLIDEGAAFDTGSYVKGDIPKGEYAFVTFDGSGSYYSELDGSGDIIGNENFSSFGYVEVHEAGDIESDGALIKFEALETLGVSGAKELYEVLNDTEDHVDSGWYKVGYDIKPGEYIIESYGSGYVAVMSGPVGNNEIKENDNFNGEYTVNVNEGDYLVISKATIGK